jgi:uncharacterized protein YlbG (UPF0298 family)
MLSNINTSIDTFQSVKSKFVETYVKNEELKKPLNTFISAQTSFAKNVAKSYYDFFTTMGMAAYTFDAKKAFAKQ